jgi:hypothetical protein
MGALGTMVCPLLSKNFKNCSLISAAVIIM